MASGFVPASGSPPSGWASHGGEVAVSAATSPFSATFHPVAEVAGREAARGDDDPGSVGRVEELRLDDPCKDEIAERAVPVPPLVARLEEAPRVAADRGRELGEPVDARCRAQGGCAGRPPRSDRRACARRPPKPSAAELGRRRSGRDEREGLDDADALLALGGVDRLGERDDRPRDLGLGLRQDDRLALVGARPSWGSNGIRPRTARRPPGQRLAAARAEELFARPAR